MQTETVPTTPPAGPVPLPYHTGKMCIMDGTGDTKVIWDSKNEVEVEVARATFKKLRKKGYLAYTVNKDGTTGEVITEFDPDAEKIILAPPVAGG